MLCFVASVAGSSETASPHPLKISLANGDDVRDRSATDGPMRALQDVP
jgi:hypothetical protein